MKHENMSLIIYFILGIVIGIASWALKNQWGALVMAVAVFVAMAYALRTVLKINQPMKWFFSNGGWVYFFVWFITWIIFYNVL